MSGSKRIVIVGASACGLRAATRARRLMPEAEITVVDRQEWISYGACGLPYFISGDIQEAAELAQTLYQRRRDPAFFKEEKDITVLNRHEARRIDREKGVLEVEDLSAVETVALPWDALVLATGAEPIGLPAVDPAHERIGVCKSVEGAIELRRGIEQGRIGRVAIVGGGYIGCELAEACGGMWGLEVDLFEAENSVLPKLLDPELAEVVAAHMGEQGVRLHTGEPICEVQVTGEGVTVSAGGTSVTADYLVQALGVRPQTGLAREAGLAVGPSGGIAVDAALRTSDPRIYAGGDCAETMHRVAGRPCLLLLGSLANRMGRVIGCNLAGQTAEFGPVVGSAAVKVFDLNVAATGLTQTACEEAGIEARAAWGTFSDCAHYWPESEWLHLKLVYRPRTLELLGLQAVGKGDAIKRVDVLAQHLQRGGRVPDLLEAEFCYAPPYAPPLDPLAALAAAALNREREGVRGIVPDEPYGDWVTLDVRLPVEVEDDPGSRVDLAIPWHELRQRVEEVPRDRPILVLCGTGMRAGEAVRVLHQHGCSGAAYLAGGLKFRQDR